MTRFASDSGNNYALARQSMIEQQLRQKGIDDARVLAVMADVPREQFVRPQDRAVAYDDRALPIELNQTISQPYMVALMTQWLDVDGLHSVLEVGTGSGYQTAILAKLARHVYTVERLAALSRDARTRLGRLGLTNVTYLVGDGSQGFRDFAPYDRIIATAAAPTVPAALEEQLADGGRLVVPVGGHDEQILTLIEKHGTRLIETAGVACRFVPLLGRQGWPEAAEATLRNADT